MEWTRKPINITESAHASSIAKIHFRYFIFTQYTNHFGCLCSAGMNRKFYDLNQISDTPH